MPAGDREGGSYWNPAGLHPLHTSMRSVTPQRILNLPSVQSMAVIFVCVCLAGDLYDNRRVQAQGAEVQQSLGRGQLLSALHINRG